MNLRYRQSPADTTDLPAPRIIHRPFFFFFFRLGGMGEDGVPVTVEFGYVRG